MRSIRLAALLFLLIGPGWAQVAHVAGGCSGGGSGTSNASSIFTFSCTPSATTHAITFFVGCAATATPTVSMSATGWTFTALSPVTGSTTAGFIASFGAIPPNTSATTFTVQWSNCAGTFANHLNEEWSGTDLTGGATTFYAHNEATGTTGGCSGAAVTSTSANDAVWSACNDNLPLSNWQGAGWTAGASDGANDGSEYKNATGSQTPVWTSSSGAFAISTVTVKAAGGGGGATSVPKRGEVF